MEHSIDREKVINKVKAGLRCCAHSMSDDDPFAKCLECPYNDESIFTDDCRAVLSRDALEVIEDAEVLGDRDRT